MSGFLTLIAVAAITVVGSLVFRFGHQFVQRVSRAVASFAPKLSQYELQYSWNLSIIPVSVRVVHVPQRAPLDDRIAAMLLAIEQASVLFEEIESDLASKQRQAEELKARALEYERLAEVNAPQAEQFLASMSAVVEKSSAGSNRWTTLNTLVGLVISIIFTIVVGYIFFRLGENSAR